ncbi:cytochrome c-type biogenesis protein CcmH [Arenicella chitinivorans]|uniref:Cytochrome c-type biogenesis protein n=1 Tax=Arenicella chitinivorans TaxID=1329800 RepID=A0A918VJI0_9GAMM|nr:cytochrome c-type biogenesis protein [Arenicella chitinivorans]GHA02337.1 cytochrome c-type biogenesis protein CcmH [Arenicella chitinivorans]
MKRILLSLLTGIMMVITPAVFGVIEAIEFDSPQQEQRYKQLIEELRCVVCQNQNIADSDADLAKDLRAIAADMIRDGKSDTQVKTFMRERYGDFVLYRTPFNSYTALIWLGPILVLLVVLIGVFLTLRRRQQDELVKPAHSDNDRERIKVRNLLRDAPNLNDTSRD